MVASGVVVVGSGVVVVGRTVVAAMVGGTVPGEVVGLDLDTRLDVEPLAAAAVGDGAVGVGRFASGAATSRPHSSGVPCA